MTGISLLAAMAYATLAATIDDYALVDSFELPAAARVFDVLPDGRIITLDDDDVFVESSVGARSFFILGTLPAADIASFGPAFLRVSPDGTKIAVGNNGGESFADFEVGVFSFPGLTGTWFTALHFEAEWVDNARLALTAGDFVNPSIVTILDTTSPDPMNPLNPTVVDNIGGASAGAAFDAAGNLYTGNGFATSGPSGTGVIKVFNNAAWLAAMGGTPLDFELQGTVVVDLLSASSLGFDGKQDLLVGGGDFVAPETNFAAVVRASDVADAVAGQGAVDANDPVAVRRLDPDAGGDSNFYAINSNPITQELYVNDSSSNTVFVYAPPSEAPAVSTVGMGVATVIIVALGAKRIRRSDKRRHQRVPLARAMGAMWLATSSARSVGGDPWADMVMASHPSLDASGLYNDPQSALGPPATTFHDLLFQQSRIVSLITPAVNRDTPTGRTLVATLNQGSFLKLRFQGVVDDDLRNPYGVDFIVFGNSFFVGDGFASPDTDLASFHLNGGLFAEPVTVAVSWTGIGGPGSNPDEWYVYENGPFADSLFPTSARLWNREASDWAEPADFTLPVDPRWAADDFDGRSAADAVAMYECSGGGTGFDLAESGFGEIRYVYFFSMGGEVDAVADVFPSLGDGDRDGDVDLRDVSDFQNCYAVSIGESGTCICRFADFDGSSEVDLADHLAMVTFESGPL